MLPIVLFVMMSAGAISMAQLAKIVAGTNRARSEVHGARAQAIADAELEIAKNIVNAAPYDGNNRNTALRGALASDPPMVPGTHVRVRRLGGEHYALLAEGIYNDTLRFAQAFVRGTTPVTGYHYFVADQGLGVTGEPVGRIHSNEQVWFHFPGVRCRDGVGAGRGFGYVAGATPETTRLEGQWNDRSFLRPLPGGITVAALSAVAETFRMTRPLVAEVEFQGLTTQIKLYSTADDVLVPPAPAGGGATGPLAPEQLLETRTVPTTGVMYFEGPVRRLSGTVNGRLTVVVNDAVAITDSIRYVDSQGNPRMLAMHEPDIAFLPNPDYRGYSALAIVARDDIRYAADGPADLEVDAALVSLEGTVACEGITLADAGRTVDFAAAPGREPDGYRKRALFRLGGVISRLRPVSVLLDPDGGLVAGFARGVSLMDANMMVERGGTAVPPAVPMLPMPNWTLRAAGGVEDLIR